MPLSFFSSRRRNSHSKLEESDSVPVDGKENNENSTTMLEAEIALDGPIGLSLTENNTVLRLHPSSPLAANILVGDRITAVDGTDCAHMSVNALLEGRKSVCLTAERKSSYASPKASDQGWAGL
jgi:C-terminal processing protease CtpA/Prc